MYSLQALVLSALASVGAAISISVDSTGGNATSGYQYGLMFEDISHSGDGGIYAELIQNRAFQGVPIMPSEIDPWTAVGNTNLTLQNMTQPLSEALPTSLNVAVAGGSTGPVGISNPGWWGIDVRAQQYTGSFYVMGTYNGTFTASLQSALRNQSYGSVQIQSQSNANGWTQHFFNITPTAAPESNNTFSLTFDAEAVAGSSLNFNLISLFPPTYKGRANGMRPDIMELLADLKPSFLRLPGGNNLEGNVAPYRWNWSATIGDMKERPGRPGTWGYYNTDGLGLVEYMNWCTDLGVEAILGVWDGLYLDTTIIPEDQLAPYVQDVLNELEFLTGATSTQYGALRASLGYPNPWSIKFIEIGNEDNIGNATKLETYQSYRFDAYYNAIRPLYPDAIIFPSTIALNLTVTGSAQGDYHDYATADMFVEQFDFFDNYTTNQTIYVGEYASVQPNYVHNSSAPFWNNTQWVGSVGEAVFLLGIERNADKLFGSAYAPILQNLNNYQWTPDLISFTADTSQTFTSTSYPLIQLFSGTRMTTTLPNKADSNIGPAYWATGYNNQTGSHILKVATYNATADVPFDITFAGVNSGAQAKLTVLTGAAPDAYNHLGAPTVVSSQTSSITAGANGALNFTLPNYAVAVLEVTGSPSKAIRSPRRLKY